MSTLKPSLEGHSADCVASSHFSNNRAKRGNRGCLKLNCMSVEIFPVDLLTYLYIWRLSASNCAWSEGSLKCG